jgi:hypothetical protein
VSEQVTLDVVCPHCGGEVAAEFADWVNSAELVEAVMTCPYCRRPWRAGFPGRLLWATKGRPASGVGPH